MSADSSALEGAGSASAPIASGVDLWLITDGKQGHETLAIGIAETLGLKFEIRRVPSDGLWSAFAPYMEPPGSVGQKGAVLAAPWPKMAIVVGRCAVPYGAALRRAARGATFVMALQDPIVSPKLFDLVWAPAHDGLQGPNVISTITGPHRLSVAAVAAAAADYAPTLADLPQKKVAVLIGGPSRAYRFAEMEARLLCAKLDELGTDIGFLLTTSRRTPKEVTEVVRAWAANKPHRLWIGEGPNPYHAFLGVADAIVVTSDSVNMLGEAVSTGKPVYVFSVPAHDVRRAGKFERLRKAIEATGATRSLLGRLATWKYAPLNANEQIATAVRARLEERGIVAASL